MRTAYLVSYDITDDKRRNAVYRTLLDYGDHVQYSVFICQLTRREKVLLRGLIEDSINTKHDQVLFLHVGGMESLEKSLECLGKSWEPPCRVQIA